ncbi:NLRC3, partial [Symbiodinium microadriaticum]
MEQNISMTTLKEATGLDDRSILFVPLLFAVYFVTVGLGTAIAARHTKRARKAREAQEARKAGPAVAPTVLGNKSSTDADADALLSPRRGRAGTWACLGRERAVQICFLCTYSICMFATVVSLATGTLSKRTGLHWEWYLGLLSLACLWHLLQALSLPKEHEYPRMAFAEATLAGMVPFMSDNFDTLKDVVFGGLCWQSERPAVKAMAWLSWLYIPAFHAYLLRKKRVLNELASHVLSVWTMATETEDAQRQEPERSDETEGPKKCCFRSMWQDKVLPILYRQTTPTKQQMLLVENAPQAFMAVLYTAAEGGSIIVSVLNIAVPILQVVGARALFPRLREAVVPWFVKKMKSAIQDEDLLTVGRLWKEAEQAPKLLARVVRGLSVFDGELQLLDWLESMPGEESRHPRYGEKRDPRVQRSRYIKLLKEMLMLAASKGPRLVLDDRDMRGDALEFQAVCSFLKKAVFVEEVNLSRNDLGAEEGQALAASIAANGSIIDLKVSGNCLGTTGMQALVRIRSLRHLDVAGNGLGAAGFQALAEALAETSLLESLDVGSNDLGPNCTEALKTVLSIATLTDFRADQNSLAGAVAKAVSAAQCKESLRQLSVAGNDLGTAGFQALAEALVETETPVEIIGIDVGSNGIGEDGSEAEVVVPLADLCPSGALQKLLLTKTLKDFRAAHNALGDAGAKVVAECLGSDRCAIERLSLVANGIGEKGFKALASSQRHAAVQLHISGNLTNLPLFDRVKAAEDLSRCFRLMDVVVSHDTSSAHDKAQEVRQALQDGHVEIFWRKRAGGRELAAALQGQSRLQLLHVNEGMDVEAVLEALKGHVALKSLVLYDCWQWKALGFALDGRSGLEELVLRGTFIPQGMQALAPALKGLAALKVLGLSNNNLRDDGAKALAESLTGMSLLERLDLQFNQIGSEGAKALAPALKGLAVLKVLDLGHNDLRDDGAKALAESLTGMSLLERLDLLNDDIGSEGAQALAPALKGLAALKVLDLRFNDLRDDGAKAVRDAVEDLRAEGSGVSKPEPATLEGPVVKSRAEVHRGMPTPTLTNDEQFWELLRQEIRLEVERVQSEEPAPEKDLRREVEELRQQMQGDLQSMSARIAAVEMRSSVSGERQHRASQHSIWKVASDGEPNSNKHSNFSNFTNNSATPTATTIQVEEVEESSEEFEEISVTFEESAWSIPMVIGLVRAGRFDMAYAVVLLLVNCAMQIMFALILLDEGFMGEDFDTQKLNAQIWRTSVAHDYKYMDLAETSLVTRVCSGDGALILSTVQ